MYPKIYLVFARRGDESPVALGSDGFARTRKEAVLFVAEDKVDDMNINERIAILSDEHKEYFFFKVPAIGAEDCPNKKIFGKTIF